MKFIGITNRLLMIGAVCMLSFFYSGASVAFVEPPNTLQFTLEGCRNDGSPLITPGGTLPNTDGNFTCQDVNSLGGNDTPYTSGNLGKGWHELDLVPHRLITKNNQNGTNAQYNVLIAADNALNSVEGYDQIFDVQIITSPSDSLNVFSDPSCSLIVGPQLIDQTGTVTGGIDDVIYRELTISQNANTTCVIEWASRLAIGASQFSGSSLQAYMFESEDFTKGKRTVPIPVKDIVAASLRKDMTATQGGGDIWNVTKQASPTAVNLGDTCDTSVTNEQDVEIRVEWSVIPSTAGEVLVVTNIYATNPAAREITINVTDTISGNIGAGIVPLDIASSGDIPLQPNQEENVLTHTFSADAGVTDLSDTVVATYSDPASSGLAPLPITGQTSASFDLDTDGAGIQPGSQDNTTAVITDTETITGNGLSYAALGMAAGSANGDFTLDGVAYTLATLLDQNDENLLWTSDLQSAANSVVFNKRVSVPAATATSGVLSDWALLTASDGATASSGSSQSPVNISIVSTALIDLTVSVEIPVLGPSETLACEVEVKNSSNVVVDTLTYMFDDINNVLSIDASDLIPDVYMLSVSTCGTLIVDGPAIQTADLTLPVQPTIDDCSDTASFVLIEPEVDAPVLVSVNKVTLPAGLENDWLMTLAGSPLIGSVELTTADSNASAFELFQDNAGPLKLAPGEYTIAETLKPGWEQISSTGCEFTVTENHTGTTQACSFTNRQLGTIIIHKVTEPSGGEGFGFTHNIGDAGTAFTLNDADNQTFMNVPAGSYTVTEDNPAPTYSLSNLVCTEGSQNSSVDVNNRRVNIELDPGETVECTFTNSEKGMVEVFKLTKGYETNDVWDFTLTGPGVNVSASTPPTRLDFGGVKLDSGVEYTLCEVNIPFGWRPIWRVDTDGDGSVDTSIAYTKDTSSVIEPELGYSEVFNPNADTSVDYKSTSTYCVNFMVDNGQALVFELNNVKYYKVASYPPQEEVCYVMKQGYEVTEAHVANNAYSLGYMRIDSCELLSTLFNSHYYNNRRLPAHYLAGKLLKAKVYQSLGYAMCDKSSRLMQDGQNLLLHVGYDGSYGYMPRKYARTAKKLALALNKYSRGRMCR